MATVLEESLEPHLPNEALDEVISLVKELKLPELRRRLFPLDSPSPSCFKSLNLLSSLPDIIELPVEVDDTLDLVRDTTYAVIGYERLHRDVKEFLEIIYLSLIRAARKKHLVMVDVMLHSLGGNVLHLIQGEYSPDCKEDETNFDEDQSLVESGCETLFAADKNEETLFDILMTISQEVPGLEEIVSKYFPGVWNAVETGNIGQLRRLINYWCYIDVYDSTGEISLIELAHETGNEQVIRLVTGAHYTLKLVHFVFSGDVYSMATLLAEYSDQIQLDFKHMTDYGAPILYYVIQSNEVEMAKLLTRYGCKIYSHMRIESGSKSNDDGDEFEVPVFHSALVNPNLNPLMMRALLFPFDEEDSYESNWIHEVRMQDLLYRMTFQGKNCLEVAIDARLNLESFRILLVASGARVVSDMNQDCKTARDIANDMGLEDYVRAIDSYVIECIQEPNKHPHQRQILALYGYDLTQVIFHDPPVDAFLSLYDDYQSQVRRLARAVDAGDLEQFKILSIWTAKNKSHTGLFEKHLSWEGREGRQNPLPLLHRAVIFNHRNIVQIILDEKPPGHSIDTLLDHMRRTALHYAYAVGDFQGVRDILRQFGCSDHSLDRVRALLGLVIVLKFLSFNTVWL